MESVSPTYLLNFFAVSLVAFAALCLADHRFHRAAAKEDPSSGEWLTHVIVFVSSTGANLSIALLFVDRIAALVLFGSCFLVKVIHELVDEFKWHLPRCGRTESFIHMGMLIFAQALPMSLFLLGWYHGFGGIVQMGVVWWAAVVAGTMGLSVFSMGELQLFLKGLKHEAK